MSLIECYRSVLGAYHRVQQSFIGMDNAPRMIYAYSGTGGEIYARTGSSFVELTLQGDSVHFDRLAALTAGEHFQYSVCKRCFLQQSGACRKKVEAVTEVSFLNQMSINLTTVAGYIAQSFRSMTLLETHPIWSTRITAHIDHTKAFGILGYARCMHRNDPNHVLSPLNR